MKERRKEYQKRNKVLVALTATLFIGGIMMLWIASMRIPALEDLSERKITQSTKIYDRTGDVLLYDMGQGIKREIIPFDQISPNVKSATLAIEDKDFYSHDGVKFSSFVRAFLVNLTTLSFSQGGSTITQQVVKNSILTRDKTPTRKFKELILALKLEKVLTKDEILSLYLNEIPYGGTVYGIQEASRTFFGKDAKDVTVAEAAYLAAVPKAPTYYSPYGSHRDKLEDRKNLVLKEMMEQKIITQEEYDKARTEKVEFKPRENNGGIKAPHFVFFVIDYLAEKYGEDALINSGFKVITTLDWKIQRPAEEIAKKYGEINTKNFNGTNNAFIAIDPKTGDILTMVGSRDYFDNAIEGNFNVSTAHRQPGSAFKPIVYAALLAKGYTPNTVLFDVPTQFSANCAPDNFTSDNGCYSPGNYDDRFRGPMTLRNSLAQSINVPAVKALYLAGVKNSISLAQSMGINSLNDPSRYGLTLVLGGGEVSLLELVSAYAVFANDGKVNQYNPILRVEDSDDNVLEEHTSYTKSIMSEQVARQITSILADPIARAPLYGAGSPVSITDRPVAVKTGTTNDYRDAWIIGYTPNIVVGTWVGNNNNTAMAKKVSGLIVAPMWRELMNKILVDLPYESFPAPEPEDPNLKPVLRGEWSGGHSILYWVNKDDPRGPYPAHPEYDSQFRNWEYAVNRWVNANGYSSGNFNPAPTPTDTTTPPTNPDGTPIIIIPPIITPTDGDVPPPTDTAVPPVQSTQPPTTTQ